MKIRSFTRPLVSLVSLAAAAAFEPNASADPPRAIASEALVNAKSGLCLDPLGDQGESRAVVQLGPCDGKPDQRWAFRKVPDEPDYFEIVNEKNGLCLDVKGYDAQERDPLILYACEKKPDQYWKKRNGALQFQNRQGMVMVAAGGGVMMLPTPLCLDFKGNSGAAGSEGILFRCDELPIQKWTTAVTGKPITPPTTNTPNAPLCASDFGPCVNGTWTGTAPTYNASGAITVGKLPTGAATLGLTGNVGINASKEFAVVGNAALTSKLPIGTEVVDVNLPSGSVAVGTGRGITSVLGKGYQYSIGGRPYVLQPSAFYAHTVVNAGFSIAIAGITASVPAGRSGEVFLGFETYGPSIYLSGDCSIPIVGPPKVKDGPPTSIAEITSCTLGWFATRPLPHTLSLKILDPTKPIPTAGAALSTVDATIDSALLLGGAITFAALPQISFNGMMALDPDSTVQNSVSFRDLSKARAGLEGDASLNVGNFSIALGNAAVLYDVPLAQMNLAAKIPVLTPFKSIGATFGTEFSGDAYAYGRFGAGSNQVVFDFSDAKLFDFDLQQFRGQLDIGKKQVAVSGRLKFGASPATLTGTFGSGASFSLTGGVGMVLDDVPVASSSLTVGTSGVRFKGSVSRSGRTWSFDETLKSPRTIKSNLVAVDATIPVINLGGKFDVWAQYTMGGNLSVKAKLKQSVGPLSADEIFDVDTDGKITVHVLGQSPKFKIL